MQLYLKNAHNVALTIGMRWRWRGLLAASAFTTGVYLASMNGQITDPTYNSLEHLPRNRCRIPGIDLFVYHIERSLAFSFVSPVRTRIGSELEAWGRLSEKEMRRVSMEMITDLDFMGAVRALTGKAGDQREYEALMKTVAARNPPAFQMPGMWIIPWGTSWAVVINTWLIGLIVCLAGSAPLLVALVRCWVARSRLANGRCGRCKYSLRGLAEPRCPECGLDWSSVMIPPD